MVNRPRWMSLAFVIALGCTRPTTPVEPITSTDELPAAEPVTANPDDWPWWRGPTSDGKARDQSVPIQWSKTENVIWRADVPGRGHSSPVIWSDRIFLTTADEAKEELIILCYERESGEPLWSTVVHRGALMKKHGKNSHASATPICDGKHIYAAFIHNGALQVTATDLNGRIAWQREAGPFGSEHGYGSSPVLFKSLVIVLGDNLTGSFVAAIDRDSGEIVWRTARKTTGRHGSYATPLVAELAGRMQLVITGMDETSSYDPETGALLWSCLGPTEVTACTPAVSDNVVFSSGGFPDKQILAIRADGSGDITESHVVWRSTKGVTYVPSPLYHDGKLYVVNDGGVASCFDTATGETIWQERLKGNFSSSPVLVGDRIFITNEAGTTYVLQEGGAFKILAENDLEDGGFATPAICGDRIFLRTETSLYCIGSSEAASPPDRSTASF